MNDKLNIIGLQIDAITFEQSMQQVIAWGRAHKPSYVCFANVHMTIEAYNDPAFQQQVNKASLVLPDGKPLAFACKWLYGRNQERIAGMDFMPQLLERAGSERLSIYLYGSTPELLETLENKVREKYPQTKIAGSISPPFRPLAKEEQDVFIQRINQSQANVVLVSLGCPKQEKWMANNYHQINAVLLGVGGAFTVTAGTQRRAPLWMQRAGMEWVFRLAQEPKRLFKRYFSTNTKFSWLLVKSMLKKRQP
jgi:N-acetylglucosaminyldiphosphoundecaprenol N-acetyl-beta-D-mannosaminyltransferase